MNVGGLRALVFEAREAVSTMQSEDSHSVAGRLVVSGMLAEQLARQLGAGADTGAVIVSEPPSLAGAAVVVRVIAGDPTDGDDELVREADRAAIPVVFVQLWPQAEWSRLFVLTPFVIECRTGEGFPVDEIARTIARAVEHPAALAARVPTLKEPVEQAVVRGAIARAALLGVVGARKRAARPSIALEQLRMLASLRAVESPHASSTLPPSGVAAATLAASFGLRAAARAARRTLPAPLVNAAVAAGGTWALAEAIRRLEARRPA